MNYFSISDKVSHRAAIAYYAGSDTLFVTLPLIGINGLNFAVVVIIRTEGTTAIVTFNITLTPELASLINALPTLICSKSGHIISRITIQPLNGF